MNTSEMEASFSKDGFLVVPSILSQEEIGSVRKQLVSSFKKRELDSSNTLNWRVNPEIVNEIPEICDLLFKPKVIIALKAILGENFVVMKECVAHYNQFGGWHKDTSAQERAGHKFQWTKDFRMVEVAFYLQDNHERFGGGLDAEPGSQRIPDYEANTKASESVFKRLKEVVMPKQKHVMGRSGVMVNSKAGDLVVFDFRLNHRATPCLESSVPKEREKYSLFFACSRNNSHVQAYQSYLGTRTDYKYLETFRFPESMAVKAASLGLTLG